MTLKILWPGRTKSPEFRRLQEFFLKRIDRLIPCRLIETKDARGLGDRFAVRILEIEAEGLEKHLKDDYIICLIDKGQEMSSQEFARFLERRGVSSGWPVALVVGGFLGLAERILDRADCLLSLSRMTMSHELSRVVLLEQIYRSLTILKGQSYAK